MGPISYGRTFITKKHALEAQWLCNRLVSGRLWVRIPPGALQEECGFPWSHKPGSVGSTPTPASLCSCRGELPQTVKVCGFC